MSGVDASIALVSSGLSHIQRGYETFTQDLYDALQERPGVMLYKGTGKARSPQIYRIPTLPRNGFLLRQFKGEDRRYRLEQLSMALGGLFRGDWARCQLIHFCDPALGGALLRLRKQFGYQYRLLFANCGPAEPKDYARFDFIQQFSPLFQQQALDAGIAAERMFLLPMGVEPHAFRLQEDKQALRQQWGLPETAYVILCVGSLDEPYKRLDWLIETVAAMADPNLFLVLAGQNQQTRHANNTLAKAEALLPNRHRHVTVPYAQMPQLYRMADLFVLPSLLEGFGKVYIEAMAAGIAILCHDSSHTRWIVSANDSRLDLTNHSQAIQRIQQLRDDPKRAIAMITENTNFVDTHLRWDALAEGYWHMYQQVLGQEKIIIESLVLMNAEASR